MESDSKFYKHLKNLMKYQDKSLQGDKLPKDYIIIYEYIIDLLKEDEIISKCLVLKQQTVSDINSDILLDLTKLFKISSSIEDSFLCLTHQDKNKNSHLEKTLHPFCDEKLSILPNKITKYVWLTLKKGLANYSPFVRGCKGDIYELSMPAEECSEHFIRIRAYNEDTVFHSTLRILIKYCKNSKLNLIQYSPYPMHDLKTEWLAVVPQRESRLFEICLPKFENSVKKDNFEFATTLRLMRFLFEDHNKLHNLDVGFIEAIVLSEFIEYSKRKNFLFQRVLFRTFKIFKTREFPYFWNTNINLIHCINETTCEYVFKKANRLLDEYNINKNKSDFTREELFSYLGIKNMDRFSYEVDQFGIFKSFKV